MKRKRGNNLDGNKAPLLVAMDATYKASKPPKLSPMRTVAVRLGNSEICFETRSASFRKGERSSGSTTILQQSNFSCNVENGFFE